MLSYTEVDVVSLILCIPANTGLFAFWILHGTLVCMHIYVDVFTYSRY